MDIGRVDITGVANGSRCLAAVTVIGAYRPDGVLGNRVALEDKIAVGIGHGPRHHAATSPQLHLLVRHRGDSVRLVDPPLEAAHRLQVEVNLLDLPRPGDGHRLLGQSRRTGSLGLDGKGADRQAFEAEKSVVIGNGQRRPAHHHRSGNRAAEGVMDIPLHHAAGTGQENGQFLVLPLVQIGGDETLLIG